MLHGLKFAHCEYIQSQIPYMIDQTLLAMGWCSRIETTASTELL